MAINNENKGLKAVGQKSRKYCLFFNFRNFHARVTILLVENETKGLNQHSSDLDPDEQSNELWRVWKD